MNPSRRKLLQSGATGLAGVALAGRITAQQAQKRPPVRLTTKEGFDAASVAKYGGNHAAIYAHIDANLDAHTQQIQRWMRQPSISAQNKGIAEMAALVCDDFRGMGFAEAEIVPTKGHPGVWGYYDAGAPKTLLVYMMYDVQPVEPEDWTTPPFEAQLAEHALGTIVRGRGATNQKGPERAFLNAVASILAVNKKLPVNLMIAAEGEEELGSPNFPQVVDKYESRMRTATACFFPFNSQDPGGAARMFLGVKGILYFELEAVGGAHGGPMKAEIHGSYKAAVDSPVWRLVQALAALTTPDGNTITVPGYYDAIRPPTNEEQRLANAAIAAQEQQAAQRLLGVDRWIDGMSASEATLRLLFDTTLNIDGIWGGYTGEGGKTILPHKATAKVDSRLVPNQKPEEQLALIRKHLDARGFTDVKIRPMSGYPPAQSSLEAPAVRAAISVFNKYGHTPSVAPRIAGSAPYYQFTDRLKLPMVAAGLGHGSGAHAPNEYMLIRPKAGSKIAGLAEIEKAYVDFLFALA